MMMCIQDHQLFKTHGDTYWRIYRDTIELLLTEASARRSRLDLHPGQPDGYPAGYIVPRFSFVRRSARSISSSGSFGKISTYPPASLPERPSSTGSSSLPSSAP